MPTPAIALIRNRHLLILSLALILMAGLAAWSSLPRIEDPRITTRNAIVITPLPGATAARVESLVTKPLEDALREVAEVKTIESTSRGSISSISLELDDSVTTADNERIFAELRDKLAEADAELPPEAGQPLLDTKRGAVAYSMILALSASDGTETRMGIANRLSEALAERLRNLPGTEQVVNFGGVDEEIRVLVDRGELAALGLTIDDVATRLAAADVKNPAGTQRGDQQQLRITVAGELDATSRVAAVPMVGGTHEVVSVGDIARVGKTWRQPPQEMAYTDGRRAVLLGVRTRTAVHLDDWAASANAQVEQARAELGEGYRLDVAFDQSRYTQARLAELGGNLLAGAAIVVLVVLVTMGWRSALIVGSALPLSTAITLFALHLAGQQVHQMSIFGMIIAIGLLIDNAIVVTDDVRKRRARGLSASAAVESAIGHLFVPLAASTFTTILGFMPILLLPGNVGDFVGPIAISVILALIASFMIAMTIIPALAALTAGDAGERHRWWRDGLSSQLLGRGYRALLRGLLRVPVVAVLLCLILPLGGFVAAGKLGMQFFPAADRDQFEVQVWTGQDAGIGRTAGRVQDIERQIRAAGDVRGMFWVAGASSPPVYYNQLRDVNDTPGYARGTVLVADPAEAKRLVGRLQRELPDAFPDTRIVVRPFGQGPPIPAPESLRLVGLDSATLTRLGDELRRIMHLVPEVTETRASLRGGEPKLTLDANEADARLAGLTLGDIASQYRNALEGATGGRVLEDLEDLPVRVRYGDAERADTTRLAALPLMTRVVSADEDAQWVPASALGELRLEPELAEITRRNGERANRIQAWLTPAALPIEVTAKIDRLIEREGLDLPPGYRLETAGDSEEQGKAVALLLAYAPLLGALMLATLVLAFRSFTLAGIVGLVAVLSAGLGMLSLWLAGFPLGFNPLLGSAGLVGVAINASIVVLAAIRADLDAAAGQVNAIVDAVVDSSRHILSTTLTTVGGFLPLLLFSAGDFWPPLGVVIGGGVGFSIILGLILTPALYRLAVAIRVVSPGTARDRAGNMAADATGARA